MKVINHVKMLLPATAGNDAFARAAVAAFCSTLSPSLEEINDIKTAVSEAVSNVIVHAYPEDIGEVEVDVTIYQTGMIEIVIQDNGIGVRNVDEAKRPFFTTKSTEEHSGMGFTIMEAFMDELEVRTEVGRGTRVTMRKTIKEHA